MKSNVHGFVYERGIKSNANKHLRRNYLINLDLKDFFPSIHFGRVRGIFMSFPFNFNEKVSTALAQICCHQGSLPQGAPTSPILSNFVCRKLDNQLLSFLSKNKCSYTRYADDITISTNTKTVSSDVATIELNQIRLGTKLIQVINECNFSINESKIRYATPKNRQEVTGLIVNNKEKANVNRKYVRQIRSMLHAWEKFGITAAAKEYFSKFNLKFKQVKNVEKTFTNIIIGKIGFVGYIKGKNDQVYRNLHSRIQCLYPSQRIEILMKSASNISILTKSC